jgi:hypothetical protein
MSTARPPSKPWRVTWPSVVDRTPHSEDFTSQSKAYDAVASITRHPQLTATVWHWVSGVWVLYERCEHIPSVADGAGTPEEQRNA